MGSTQVRHHDAWNKGKRVGRKAPFKRKEIWSIRVRLEMQDRSALARSHEARLCPAGHRLESAVHYLGVEVDDALEMAEQTED